MEPHTEQEDRCSGSLLQSGILLYVYRGSGKEEYFRQLADKGRAAAANNPNVTRLPSLHVHTCVKYI